MLRISEEHPPQWTSFSSQLLRLTWPIVISMLSYSLMTAVDTLFVGRKGALAIAAVGLGGLTSFTLLTFAMGLLRAGKVLMAHAYGANEYDRLDPIARASVLLSVLLSCCTLAATILLAPLLRQAFDDAAAGDLVVSYVLTRAAAIPFFLAATSLRECSQALGDTRRPMYAAVISNLANIPLNALLVLVFDWGVVGSALANVIAQLIDFACLAVQRRGWLKYDRSSWEILGRISRMGWPLGVEMLLDVSSFSTLALIIARLGTVELAAHQIALQISHITILPVLALAESTSVLAGQSVGAKRHAHVRPLLRCGIVWGLGYALLLGALLFSLHGAVAAVFTGDPGVQRLTSILLQVVAGFNLGFVLYALGRGVLRGLGDVQFTACVTIGVAWVCTPTLGFLLGHVMGWGVMGGWCGISLEVTLAALLYASRLESGAWSKAAYRINDKTHGAGCFSSSESLGVD